MAFPRFELERYFARWEFSATHLLGSSDAEGWRMDALLALADDETAALWRGLKLGYTESRGHPLLRAEIARLYGGGVESEDVLTFTGAEEAIFAAMHVLLREGDHVIALWPAYASLHQIALSLGAEVTRLELRAEDGWRLDVAALERALRPNTRLVIWNFPHNPTGAVPDPATHARAIDRVRSHGARLFSDEVYRWLEADGVERLPAAAESDPRAVTLGVLSKSFGLAGLRVGWIASKDRALLDELAAFKDYLTICSSAPSELLALIALRAKDRVLERSRALVSAGRRAADAFFAAFEDRFEWIPPRGGTVAFPRLREGDVQTLADELVRREGVLILPGSLFDHGGNHFRVGLGRTNTPEAFERFARFLRR